ncbi:hypothetical protein ACET3Z_002343 [Daucus carota]
MEKGLKSARELKETDLLSARSQLRFKINGRVMLTPLQRLSRRGSALAVLLISLQCGRYRIAT